MRLQGVSPRCVPADFTANRNGWVRLRRRAALSGAKGEPANERNSRALEPRGRKQGELRARQRADAARSRGVADADLIQQLLLYDLGILEQRDSAVAGEL